MKNLPRHCCSSPHEALFGSSLCFLHLIPCVSVMKCRSQLGSASPTDSLLALGQIQNFNANSYSNKTPNWLPEILTVKFVSAIPHNSCKTSMSLENILGILLDLEKSLFRIKFSFTSPLPLQLQQSTTVTLQLPQARVRAERVTQPQKFEVLLRPVVCFLCSPLTLLHCPV